MTEHSSNTTSIEVADLSYRYPDGTQALRELSLHVAPGERVAILGPNGSGKTTLAHHLNGLIEPPLNTVTVEGLDVGDQNAVASVRRLVQILFANPDDQLFMPTVEQDVAFGPANLGHSGSELRTITNEALRTVGAEHLSSRTPHRMSTGEKKRAALAAILAMRPTILVLDEPTAGLDPSGRRALIELLAGLDQTMLIISHDLGLAAELCPRSIVLDQGSIAVDMNTADLLDDDEMLASLGLELPFGFR